ncbi:MAG: NAD(P)/FAD-dependent oxidoreductase [Acidobacteria bacterium]|nr:NAD(P)/FAD-dependent oxidoreductase [Acidobacteriota bacterium]
MVEYCDALIVGGGPAGSSCAWMLSRAGLDVVVLDRARFPRDKVCAGWITPQVIAELDIDPGDYAQTRTWQPITGFEVGLIGSDHSVAASYERPISFGIRRCEFDDFLLRRSGARLRLGAETASLRRVGACWIADDALCAPVLIGAGGHFCPVARLLNGTDLTAIVAAREIEMLLDDGEAGASPVDPARPELYFCRDLQGYGWCVRKGAYLNVGFGRRDPRALPADTAAFVEFLRARRRLPPAASSSAWHGHAYRLAPDAVARRIVDHGVLLAGDSAGVAYGESGEGIRPAIESGLLAASTIIEAAGHYDRDRLQPYADSLRRRLGASAAAGRLSAIVAAALPAAVARRLLASRWFVRHVVLDRWFLHTSDVALVA